jgi:hypothetical protein
MAMPGFAICPRASGAAILCASLLCAGSPLAADAPNFAPNPNVGWVAAGPHFIAPPAGPGPVMDDPAHPRVTNDAFRAGGRQPTFPVGDLSSPILQPWAREQMRRYNARVLAGEPAFARQASCWPAGVPGFLLYPIQPVYFLQTPEKVVMIWQADHQVRHVYLNVPHSARVKVSDYGESVGHYEGDTLVVDTIGLHTRTFVDNYQTPHSEKLHVVERFRMIEGGKTMEVQVRVEDPGAFTTPWSAIQRYRRVEPRVADVREAFNAVSSSSAAGPILEASCAENPDALFGADTLRIPQADRPDF